TSLHTLFPYTTLFRSDLNHGVSRHAFEPAHGRVVKGAWRGPNSRSGDRVTEDLVGGAHPAEPGVVVGADAGQRDRPSAGDDQSRSEEHTSELQSRENL